MKIDMVTLQEGRNYGAVLQAFASVKFFESHGCSLNVLNTVREAKKIWPAFKKSFRGSILKMPFRVLSAAASLYRANKIFNDFRYRFIKISPEHQFTDMKDFENYKSDADAFCTGSDQVWNVEHHNTIYPQFYLAFAPEGSYKFSFSSSFGRDKVLPEEVSETQKYINEYRHISVREASGVAILKEQYHYDNAVNIQDPTLCIDPETWREYVKSATGERRTKDYILVYKLYGFKDNEYDYVHKLSEITGLKILRITFDYRKWIKALLKFKHEQLVFVPDVFRFVSLIDNARYVLTDSFHGTAFSLNLNTEPICIYPQRFSTRIESILRLTKTLHRHLESYDDFDILNRPVNFDEVNQILNAERKKAYDWLKMILSEIREYKTH